MRPDSEGPAMWTNENRARYDRSHLRYPSDLTDDEWKLVEPLIPPGKRGGDKRTVIMREIVNGLMYILSTGCQWRAIPKDLPPRSTLYDYFDLWSWDGTLDLIHHELYVKCREAIGREASPTAAVIDSQSVKSAEKDAMGRAARTMAPSSLQRINGAPHATAERFEQIPRNSRTRCNTDRRDRDGPVELAGRRYRAWRRALAVEEARGR
jgi:transposase